MIDQQTANWSRDEATNLMTNWLSTGAAFDGVIANNDEMALGVFKVARDMGRPGLAGGLCALLGIVVSWLLGDVQPIILVIGTLSSAAGGLIGGAIGKVLK